MLTTIVKRNGTVEDFIPAKANHWAIWAGKGLEGRIDWPTVVREVIRTSPEQLSSQEFQDRLINTCLLRYDYPHNLMAGRLYSVYLRKKMFGDELPTVKQMHDKLVKLGLMLKPDYSDTEYDIIQNDILDMDLDFKLCHSQVKSIYSRYVLSNRVTGEKYELPQYTFMRMAMALCERYVGEERIERVRSFYLDFANNRVNAPTPNYTNLGTHQRSYASCCLYAAGDTAKSIGIANEIAYTMTTASAGIGGVKIVRSVMDPVRGGAIEHHGKFPYFRATAATVSSSQQGSRGGALTEYVSVFDPEIVDIAMAQNPRTALKAQIRECHFAVMTNTFFARKAAKRENIFTFNIFTAPDLMKKFFSADIGGFEELYNKYEADPNFKKNYLNAYDLAVLIETQPHEVSTMYWLAIDEVNRHTPFKDPILSSNLCVAPETLLLTDKGHFCIEALCDQSVSIWNGFEWSEVVVRQTSEASELVTVKTTYGQEITCTPYHKFYVQVGYTSKEVEVRAGELEPGMALVKFDLPVIEGENQLDKPYANGFYTGDGCLTPQGQRVYLYHDKMLLKEEFPEIKNWVVQHNQKRIYGHYQDLMPKYFVPDASYDISSRLEWLAGFLDADGCIYRNGTNESITSSSVNLEFLKEVQLMLQTLGVFSKISKGLQEGPRLMPANNGTGEMKMYYCLKTYRLLISSYDSQKLLNLGLNLRRLKIVQRQVQRAASQFIRVTEVVNEGRVDATYCFTEPKRHRGVFNGILTGQCIEVCQPAAPYHDMRDLYLKDHERGEISTCNLSGIPISRIKNDEEYEQAAYNALDMIDQTIHLAEYPYPHLEYTARSRMNAAVGMLGVAEYMAKRGIYYSSQYGLETLDFLAERHYYFLLKAALRLGKERGNAPWMHKTKWPEGWLPIDTYKHSVDKIVPHKLRYDWEGLRKEIIANGGIRFSVLCAHMPTETSSKAAGVPNGPYPVRALYLKKSDMDTALDWLAPDGDLYADTYEIAYDVPVEYQIKMYAVLQKWCDGSISADYYEDRVKNPTLESDVLVSRMLDRHRYGHKSKYYQNSLTSKDEDISIIKKPAVCTSGGCDL